MELKKIFSQVRDLIHKVAGASLSFGAVSQIGNASIIPVARIAFGFGGGGGKGGGSKKKPAKEAPNEAETQGAESVSAQDDFGGGLGGGIKTEPIGIFLINAEKVRFYPVFSLKDLLAFSSFFLWIMFKIWRLKRLKKR